MLIKTSTLGLELRYEYCVICLKSNNILAQKYFKNRFELEKASSLLGWQRITKRYDINSNVVLVFFMAFVF